MAPALSPRIDFAPQISEIAILRMFVSIHFPSFNPFTVHFAFDVVP